MDALSHAQAALGVAEGGLGMRRARRTALPAFVASRVESRWIVQTLAEALTGFLQPALLMAAFDAETAAAQNSLARSKIGC